MSKSPIERLRERSWQYQGHGERVVPLSTAEEIVGKLEERLGHAQRERDEYDLMSIKLCAERDDLSCKLEQAREALSIAKRDIISITNAARERILDLGGSCDPAQKTWMQPVERIEQALAALTPEEKQDANVE